jgi:GT2 family glycosyltransferase
MKVCVVQLYKDRIDLTRQSINQNFYNSGYNAITCLVDDGSKEQFMFYPFDKIIINGEHKGISYSINQGIKYAVNQNCDAIAVLANDILMPNDWLKTMVEHIKDIPHTGFCGIHCVEDAGTQTNINGRIVNVSENVYGNVIIPMKVIDAIGFFNEDYDPYGVQDSDYCYRMNKVGFINYYVNGLRSDHIGFDVGQNSEYRKMKDASLEEKWHRLSYWKDYYDQNGYKIWQRYLTKGK